MAKSILITGGAASGKSRWAVSYFAPCDYVLYLKAGAEIDVDTRNRIDYSCKMHEVEWDVMTYSEPHPVDAIGDHKFVILDSLSSYTRMVMDEMCPDIENMDNELRKKIEHRIIDEIVAMRDKIEENFGCLLVITLETGFSVTPDDKRLAAFRHILGTVNQRIANTSQEVYFSASGIQFKIK